MSIFHRALFFFETGAFGGTSPTLSAVLQIQDSPDGTTWTSNATVPSATVTTASKPGDAGNPRRPTYQRRQRYVRLQAVCTIGGTSPTIPVAVVGFGDEAAHKPGSPERRQRRQSNRGQLSSEFRVPSSELEVKRASPEPH